MKPFVRFSVMVISAFAMGCATMNVGSHVERGLDFAQYRTFDWGPADALPTGDPRLDQDLFFQDHFQGEVEKQLALEGFERSTSRPPDLQIHYHASVTRRIDVDRADRALGYCYDDDCPGGVIEYEVGTLVLDLVDTGANKLIWRGWAQTRLEDMLHDRDRMARQIHEAVTAMLATVRRGPAPARTGEK